MEQPTYTLTFEDVARMRQPLVYVRRRVSDGKAVYIGSSMNGLIRPLERQHQKVQLADGEVLEIYLTGTPAALEAAMILLEQPELNQQGPHTIRKGAGKCAVCHKDMASRNRNTIFCSEKCQKSAREFPQQNKELRQRLYHKRTLLEEHGRRDANLCAMLEATIASMVTAKNLLGGTNGDGNPDAHQRP